MIGRLGWGADTEEKALGAKNYVNPQSGVNSLLGENTPFVPT